MRKVNCSISSEESVAVNEWPAVVKGGIDSDSVNALDNTLRLRNGGLCETSELMVVWRSNSGLISGVDVERLCMLPTSDSPSVSVTTTSRRLERSTSATVQRVS
jgi:hypothetical protein